MKEKLQNALGTFGGILYWSLIILIAILPLVMIGTPFWATFIILAVCSFLPFLSVPLWIWGFVEAIKGPQDIFAIIYYIATIVVFLPTIISMISGFIGKREKNTKNNEKDIINKTDFDNNSTLKKSKPKERFKTATIILSVTAILFATSTICLSIGIVNLNNDNQELTEQITNLESDVSSKDKQIDMYKEQISNLKSRLNNFAMSRNAENNGNRLTSEEIKSQIVYCTNNSSPYYHTSTCPDCDRNGFTIWFDTDAVESAGYLPCPNCIEQ